MAEETGNRFNQLNAEFEHDFESLSVRVARSYVQLDELAHRNGSQHGNNEELYMEVQSGGEAQVVVCDLSAEGYLRVRVQDSQGDPKLEYWCNITRETPGYGEGSSKHRDGGPAISQGPQLAIPQNETLVVMAAILEQAYSELSKNKRRVIRANEKQP